ncbi:MAG: archaellin/type IV pilin N-terminal domain-containing protein [archaeon]
MKKEKGVSPVIATVLLVAMVIVIALIVFLWIKGIGGEVITKFEGQNIEIVCGEVDFSSDYVNDKIHISNTGNVPIYSMKVKIEEPGGYETYDLGTQLPSGWPPFGLNQGEIFNSRDIGEYVGSAEVLVLTPVLMGSSDKGERAFVCDEGQHGYEIAVY